MGREIGATLPPGTVLALQGPLGAGKTVLTKGIALGLEVTSTITSPSYTIVVEHQGRLPLRHIDLYRTGSIEELELLGFDELTSGDGVTVIEWGEKADYFLDDKHIEVSIVIRAGGAREITISDPKGLLEQKIGLGERT